jgi:hypothetical protein
VPAGAVGAGYPAQPRIVELGPYYGIFRPDSPDRVIAAACRRWDRLSVSNTAGPDAFRCVAQGPRCLNLRDLPVSDMANFRRHRLGLKELEHQSSGDLHALQGVGVGGSTASISTSSVVRGNTSSLTCYSSSAWPCGNATVGAPTPPRNQAAPTPFLTYSGKWRAADIVEAKQSLDRPSARKP